MNKHQFHLRQAFQRLKNQTRHHSDIIASTACGLVMGMLFLTYLGENEAKRASLVPAGEKRIVVQETTMSESSVSSSAISSSEDNVSESTIATSSSSVSSVATLEPKLPEPPRSKPAPAHKAAISVSSSLENVAASEATSASSPSSPASSAPSPESSASSSSVASTAISSSAALAPVETHDFPAFDHTSFPVAKAPNWGAMRTPAEWNRAYADMTPEDYVAIPRYDMSKLTIPMSSINNPVTEANIPTITAKLFYSTRYLGMYDLDAAEGSGKHAGVDLKLPRGTPIGAIAGGRVSYIGTSHELGLFVMVEHRLKNGQTFYSIYAHFDRATVTVGQDIEPGEQVGNVGMTGNTSGPHLHLQVDHGEPGGNHTPFQEGGDAAAGMVNPITFISMYRNGEQ